MKWFRGVGMKGRGEELKEWGEELKEWGEELKGWGEEEGLKEWKVIYVVKMTEIT